MGNCFGSGPPVGNNPSSTTPSNAGTSSGSCTTSGGEVSGQSGGGQFGEILPSPKLKIYSFSDLRSATKNFKADMVVGVGGFGTVYRGCVDGKTLGPLKHGAGIPVAIKKLNPESVQGFDQWQTEVNFLGRLSHHNLVKLLGYCWEDEELLLVYEFMLKGSLENHLFRRVAALEPLSWDLRLKIAIGAAKGLAFLHSSDKKIIYRDFKSSNILLDEDYNAKLSDFGLAKLGPLGGDTHVTTRIMGTRGYVAPEYITTGHLYVKSDVYGFGVMLLEMLTGLRARDLSRPSGQDDLVTWMKPLLCKRWKLKSVVDARIEGQYSSKAMLQAAKLTLRCLEELPRKRPSMEEVVDALEHILTMESRDLAKKNSMKSSSPSQPSRIHLPPAGLNHNGTRLGLN